MSFLKFILRKDHSSFNRFWNQQLLLSSIHPEKYQHDDDVFFLSSSIEYISLTLKELESRIFSVFDLPCLRLSRLRISEPFLIGWGFPALTSFGSSLPCRFLFCFVIMMLTHTEENHWQKTKMPCSVRKWGSSKTQQNLCYSLNYASRTQTLGFVAALLRQSRNRRVHRIWLYSGFTRSRPPHWWLYLVSPCSRYTRL